MSLDFYWQLAENDHETRIKATDSLLKDLKEKDNDEQWDYSINRLLKGLNSSRDSARIGFCLALTEVLSERKNFIDINNIIEKLIKFTTITGKISKQEQRDYLFGQMFGLQSILNSDLASIITFEQYQYVIKLLISLALQKSWIREPALWILVNSIKSFSKFKKIQDDEFFKWNIQYIDSCGLSKTPEGVSIYLSLPKKIRKKFDSIWKNGNPLETSNMALLAKVLKENYDSDDNNTTNNNNNNNNNKKNLKSIQKGLWNPKIHFVWKIILENLLNEINNDDDDDCKKKNKNKDKDNYEHKSKKKKISHTNVISFKDFWRIVVDESLFASSSSSERKYWGLQVFNLYFPQIPSEFVPYMFSKNLMRCLINQASDSNRYLNKAAKQVLSVIFETAKENPIKTPVILKSILTGENSVPNFDRLTKSKTIDSLVNLINIDQINELSTLFISIFAQPEENDVSAAERRRQWVLDQLLNLVKNKSRDCFKSSEISTYWLDKIIVVLSVYGHFTVEKSDANKNDIDNKSLSHYNKKLNDLQYSLEKLVKNIPAVKPPLSETTQSTCRARLGSCLSIIMPYSNSDGTTWPFRAVKVITSIVPLFPEFKLTTAFDTQLQKVHDRELKLLERIRKKRSAPHADNSQLKAFELLFSLVILQLYNADSEAAQVLEELHGLYNSTTFSNDLDDEDNTSSINKKDSKEFDSNSLIILTEILLSFMTKNSALLRKLAETVWSTFAKNATIESIKLLTDVLYTKESSIGQNELFEIDSEIEIDEESDDSDSDANSGSDSSSDSDSDSDSDSSSSSDSDLKEKPEVNKTESSDEDSSSSESESGEISTTQIRDKEMNKKLAKALGIRHSEDNNSEGSSMGEDDEGENSEEDDDDDEDDDAMDDNEMMALDKQLSIIFKERFGNRKLDSDDEDDGKEKKVSRKKQAAEARENVIQFKSRVLDLLEIYFKCINSEISKQNDNDTESEKTINLNDVISVILLVIPAIVTLIGTTTNLRLGERSHNILRNKICKLRPVPIIENDKDAKQALKSVLNPLHETIRKPKNRAQSQSASQSSVFIARMILGPIQKQDKSKYPRFVSEIVDIYGETLKDWILQNRNDGMKPNVFFEFINWISSAKGGNKNN